MVLDVNPSKCKNRPGIGCSRLPLYWPGPRRLHAPPRVILNPVLEQTHSHRGAANICSADKQNGWHFISDADRAVLYSSYIKNNTIGLNTCSFRLKCQLHLLRYKLIQTIFWGKVGMNNTLCNVTCMYWPSLLNRRISALPLPRASWFDL